MFREQVKVVNIIKKQMNFAGNERQLKNEIDNDGTMRLSGQTGRISPQCHSALQDEIHERKISRGYSGGNPRR